MEEQKQNLNSYVIKYSIIIALISIIINTLVYIIDETMMIKWWFGLISIAITFGLLIYFGISIRNETGGYMSFKTAFITIFLIVFFSTIISIGYSLVLHNLIDPDLKNRLSEAMIEQTTQMMERFGVPEDQMDEALEKVKQQDNFSTLAMLKSGGIVSIVIGLLFGLIVGAIIKKKVPEHDIM